MDLEEEIHLEVAEGDFPQALSSLAEVDFQEDLALNFNEKKVFCVFKFFLYQFKIYKNQIIFFIYFYIKKQGLVPKVNNNNLYVYLFFKC